MINRNFADRMIEAIEQKGNPCMVGLDPRFEQIPDFIFTPYKNSSQDEIVESVLVDFNTLIINTIKDLVPTIKIQSAFYEAYGIPRIKAFARSIQIGKDAGLIVAVDAKRNDIGATAEAYANAFIGESSILGEPQPIWNADVVTVS